MSAITAAPSPQIRVRPTGPRAFVVPIVRPVPRRPAGLGRDDTW